MLKANKRQEKLYRQRHFGGALATEVKLKLPGAFGPLDDAQRILRMEVERAVFLFPNDECEAICELMRRSHSLPDLKRVLLLRSAFIAVAKALETGRGSNLVQMGQVL